ncbi:S8 family serine peptidase [Nocardioides sp. YIM 152588]|uniref:S8 family serine peptidase n=1 Tax=Nocardioides sp. YIM 152588 TaxID=3158259 RepID=UPI0032E37152
MVPPVRGAARPHHSGRTRRSRGLAALALTLAGMVGLSAMSTPAWADPDPLDGGAGPGAEDGSGATAAAEDVREFRSGRYIVVLAAPPATGYAATRAGAGRGFDARTPQVRAYSDRLAASHEALGDDLGFDVERSFTIATNGFVADLSARQATELAGDRRVLLVERNRLVHADTWNTPSFLGLTGRDGAWREHGGPRRAGAGVVVGVIDSGIWPESKSFRAAPLTAAPRGKWDLSIDGTTTRMEKADGRVFHGECEAGEEFDVSDCNGKIISARYFVDGYGLDRVAEDDYASPRDGDGHGTHTASTAAGVRARARVEGVRFGTVSGMAPAAKVAVYKALWATEDGSTATGTSYDLVSAIDQAVADGVDVINYSVSGPTDTTIEAAEIAFEGAAEAGVFVAASAGNEGPGASTVAHNSPWLTTVAANTHYSFENTLVLGNGKKIVGASISDAPLPSSPLVAAVDSGNGSTSPDDTALCAPDSLDPAIVGGTIVVCDRGIYDRVAKSAEVARAGGVGMVLANVDPGSLDADFHSVPTIHIPDTKSPVVYDYLDAAGASATASFVLGNQTRKVTPVPQVAGFSSRGPAASDDSDLLKPDISAPGVSILAAVAPPSNSGRDYDLYSGTSMAAPHIAGLAAFMYGVHPYWSPMRVKSAMMTTATNLKDADGKRSRDLFAQGSGQVRPTKMFDPGLFVVSDGQDWRGYLTGRGLDTGVPAIETKDLNVPSMAQGYVSSETSLTRRFTASRPGVWNIRVQVPGFEATADRAQLVSKRRGDLEDVTFHFQRTTAPLGEFAFGYAVLTGPTRVRLPIALRPVSVKAPTSVAVEGAGSYGSTAVDIVGGFDGDLDVATRGLVEGFVDEGALAVGDSAIPCVTIGAGSELAQFDLVAPDPDSDLDLYVYAADTCDPSTIFAYVGDAATPSAGETFTAEGLPEGTYIVEVNAYDSGSVEPVPYSLRVYDVGGSPEVGDLTVTPNPVPIETGVETSYDLGWSGLDPDAHYFGLAEYAGAPNPTYIYIDTTS